MHPYEMHQRLIQAEALGLVWRLKQSHLYAILGRLEDEGYIASITEPQGTRPPRKVMHLTGDGRMAFERWMAAPVSHGRDFRVEFLAKLYFAQQEGPAAVAQLVSAQRAACARWLADLNARVDTSDPSRPFVRLVLQFRAGQIGAILAWLDMCEASFRVARS
jgi:DNA-binding PadR family transcriptional regulator